MPHIAAAVCRKDHGAVLFDRGEINVFALKQLFVAEEQLSSVQLSREAVSGRLVHLAEPRPLYAAAVGLQNGLGNGVCGNALAVGRKRQELFLAEPGALRRVNADHAELTPRERPCLIEDQGL